MKIRLKLGPWLNLLRANFGFAINSLDMASKRLNHRHPENFLIIATKIASHRLAADINIAPDLRVLSWIFPVKIYMKEGPHLLILYIS